MSGNLKRIITPLYKLLPTTTMIEIIENPPVIFTKDKSFVTYKPLQPGDIIHLPEDAVLLVLPINHPTN